MPKAVSRSTTQRNQNPDSALIEMIQRHDTLWAEWDRRLAAEECTSELCDECCDLELRVVATPAFTRKGLQGKRRVAKCASQFHEGDAGVLLDGILRNDAERVGAR